MKQKLFPGELYALDETPATTPVTITFELNTSTYADVEHIIEEISESLGWLAYDHDAIIDAEWEAYGDSHKISEIRKILG